MKKSSEMPEPQVLDYHLFYDVTPLFINDFKKVMSNVPYVEAKRLLDKVEEHNNRLPAAVLNELIRDISGFPYKYVAGFMDIINKPENFARYFVKVPMQQEVNNGQNKQ